MNQLSVNELQAPLSLFDVLTQKVQENPSIIPLHQGKTVFDPNVFCTEQVNNFPIKWYEHAPPSGISQLKEAIVQYLYQRFDITIATDRIAVTAGSTHALSISLRSILRAGDEIIVLSPHWLFINGIIEAAGGHWLEVPLFMPNYKQYLENPVQLLRKFLSPKTRAIYLNTPNNPTGISLTKRALKQLLNLCHRLGLWLISDNAYEQYDFSDDGFIEPYTLDNFSNNIISIYTFSKTFVVPGLRIGFAILPDAIVIPVQKQSLYSMYSLTTFSQRIGYQLLTQKNLYSLLNKRR